MLRTLALGAGLTALLASPAFAHHPSGVSPTSGAGPIATISATTLDKGQSVAGIVLEAVQFDAFSDAQLIDFAGKHIHAHSLDAILAPSLVFAYGLTDDLTLSARLPVIVRQNIREGSHEHPGGAQAVNSVVDLGDSSGIGDLTLLGQYRFYNNRAAQTEAAALVGASSCRPAGPMSSTTRAGVSRPSSSLAAARSIGFLGLAFTKRFGAWSFDANVLYQFTGDRTQDTNLGDRLPLQRRRLLSRVRRRLRAERAHADGLSDLPEPLPEPMYHGGPKAHQHRHAHHEEAPCSERPALDLVLEVNGEWHDHQRIGEDRDPTRAATRLSLAGRPGCRWTSGRGSSRSACRSSTT